MTRDECKELLAIMKAYAEGAVIEHLCGGEWVVVYNPTFSLPAKFYRIKPNVPAEVYVNVYPDGHYAGPYSTEAEAASAKGNDGETVLYVRGS